MDQKLAVVAETMQPGMSISYVARRHGLSPSLVFRWRRLMSEGGKEAIRADEEVVPASEQSGEFKELDERTRHVRRLILGALLQLAIGSAVGPLQGPPLALRAPSKLGVLVAQPCTSPADGPTNWVGRPALLFFLLASHVDRAAASTSFLDFSRI